MAERKKLEDNARDDVGKARLFAEYGVSGLKRWSGVVDEEWLTQLATQEKRHKIYREMRDNDPVVGAVLFAIEMLVRQATWRVSPASPSDEHTEAADFVQGCLDDMSSSWSAVVSEALTFLTYGWSYHEIVYKQRLGEQPEESGAPPSSRFADGRIGWRKLPGRAQDSLDRWEFDAAGGLRGMWQSPPPDYRPRFVPIEKALLFRTTSERGSPEGRSILRNCWRPWFFKKRIEEIEGIGVERDLAGFPVITAPARIMQSGATAAEASMYTQLKKMVRNIRRDEQEGMVLPSDRDEKGNALIEFKLVSTGGGRQFSTTEVIHRYDSRIAASVMADFILLGQQRVGSFALASSKTELFSTAIGAYLDGIAEVMNRHAIPRLFAINGWAQDKLPKMDHGDVEMPNLGELGQFLMQLTAAGAPMFPDEDLEDHLRDMARLPKRKPGAAGAGGDPIARLLAAQAGAGVKSPEKKPVEPEASEEEAGKA